MFGQTFLSLSVLVAPVLAHSATCEHNTSCGLHGSAPLGGLALLQKTKRKGQVTGSIVREDALCSWGKYHSSEELLGCIQSLTERDRCNVPLSTEWVKDVDDPSKSMFVARIGNANAEKRVLVAANEHARELITAEIALRFVQNACGASGQLKSTLDEIGITVMPVVNLEGRKAVEKGDDCLRYTTHNEGYVDLNRNMDVDFKVDDDAHHGSSAFSTYQTRIMRDLAAAEQPLAYIDLHSGARSLMVSWGARSGVTPDWDSQLQMLTAIKTEHCTDCQMGSNKVVINYMNEGEIIDHMYARQRIKYSTLWEVWDGQSQLADGEPLPPTCTNIFNPPANMLLDSVENWAGALERAARYVHANVSSDERTLENVEDTKPIVASIMLQEASIAAGHYKEPKLSSNMRTT